VDAQISQDEEGKSSWDYSYHPRIGYKGKALLLGIITSLDASRRATPYRLLQPESDIVHEEDLAKLQVTGKPKNHCY
jgi:hypothetical protein